MPRMTDTEALESIAAGVGAHRHYRIITIDLTVARAAVEVLPAGVTARALTVISAPAGFTLTLSGGSDAITAERGLAIEDYEIASILVTNTAAAAGTPAAQLWISW